MMVSFAQREDCFVVDEPFYAAYLEATQLDHPMMDEIIAAGESDPKRVADFCTGPVPDGKQVFYQKHMTHHMIPQFDRQWMSKVNNVFLIRDPSRVIASYNIKRENPTLADIGVAEQYEIFAQIADLQGRTPIVIDSADILSNPALMLGKFCHSIGLEFDKAMLTWPRGPKPYDGVWAGHWYESVWASTGFAKPNATPPIVPEALRGLADEAQRYYAKLRSHAISMDNESL